MMGPTIEPETYAGIPVDPQTTEASGEGVVHATDAQTDKPETTKPKKRKKVKRSLTTETVAKSLHNLGGEAQMGELIQEIYSSDEDSPKTRSRVRHHLSKLEDEGRVTASGSTNSRRYKLSGATVPVSTGTDPGIGDLFEVIGLLGDHKVVRSLDTHQVFKLEGI